MSDHVSCFLFCSSSFLSSFLPLPIRPFRLTHTARKSTSDSVILSSETYDRFTRRTKLAKIITSHPTNSPPSLISIFSSSKSYPPYREARSPCSGSSPDLSLLPSTCSILLKQTAVAHPLSWASKLLGYRLIRGGKRPSLF